MKAPQLTTRIDVTGKRVQVVAVPAREVFTEASAKDHVQVARQINQLQRQVEESSLPARSAPRLKATYFEGLTFTGGGQQTIRHGYTGAPVRWQVVRWYGTGVAAGPNVFEVSQDQSTGVLVLQAVAAGSAEVEVWPR